MNRTTVDSRAESGGDSGALSGRDLIRRIKSISPDTLLAFLTDRQFVQPHASVASVLKLAEEQLDVCGVATRRSVAWLGLDEKRVVGRLRRTELTQLARSICRFMRHTGLRRSPVCVDSKAISNFSARTLC